MQQKHRKKMVKIIRIWMRLTQIADMIMQLYLAWTPLGKKMDQSINHYTTGGSKTE